MAALTRYGFADSALNVHCSQRVTFGTPSWEFIRSVRERLIATGELIAEQSEEIEFQHAGYRCSLRHTPQFSAEWPTHLNT